MPSISSLRECCGSARIRVPLDSRSYDLEKAVRFYTPLLRDAGLLTASADDLVKAVDLKIFKELSTELKK